MTINLDLPSMASWKTSLAGILSLVVATYTGLHEPSFQAAAHDPQFQLAIVAGIGLLLSKDSNVTGGTKGQPSTLSALTDANVAPHPENKPEAK